jgi:hypothetical protein
MKFDTYDKYLASDTNLPTQALLTAWDCLAAFRGDLVLVGGLAVRYLTKPAPSGKPGAVTLDIDFAISMGVGGNMYGSVRETLSAHGFKWSDKRFTRAFPGLNLHIDLLTDDGQTDKTTVVVDDGLQVSVLPGIDRALACWREVEVTGATLLGTVRTEKIKVAEVGPLLALKLNAFGGPDGRKAGKDAHDILYLVTQYLGGIPAAVAGFHTEKTASNRAMPHAIKCLTDYFSKIDDEGPVACAAFQLNNQHETAEMADESSRIRQLCVTLSKDLLG